ncbi:MAG: threonylcarbamoyl-AMP synthase [Actinobacteria bacterium]|nr:threonylcarbamoyl-AMP synthase [Actinomycetota bacterium]
MSYPVEDAVAAALRGELIVFPTDTVYGMGTRPDDPAATARLFEAKGRRRDLALAVLVPSTEAAREIAVLGELAEMLAAAFWPGALTLVLPRAERARAWELGGDPATVGVRLPHHPLALAVLAGTGPLAVSSANRSGEPTPAACDGLVDAFGDLVAVYLCQEEPLVGAASTVLDLAGEEPRMLREGAVGREALAGFLDPSRC